MNETPEAKAGDVPQLEDDEAHGSDTLRTEHPWASELIPLKRCVNRQ